MKQNNKIMASIMEWLLSSRHSGKLVVDETSLFDALANEKEDEGKIEEQSKHSSRIVSLFNKIHNLLLGKYRRSFRFVMIVSTLFFVLVFTIHFGIVFIKDVILYDAELNVNEQGALNPRKSLSCEHAMYLFSPSEIWANTGVRINKGDRFRINISGGANTSIYDAIQAAQENLKPRFKLIRFDTLNEAGPEPYLKYCLSKGASHESGKAGNQEYRFGTIIYTIQSEDANVIHNPLSVPTNEMFSWTPGNVKRQHSGDRDFRKAEKSGFLYLSINDIVFDDYIDEDKKVVDADEEINEYISADYRYFKDKMIGDVDSTQLIRQLDSILKNNHSKFYEDNTGQVLVSMEIIRHQPREFFNPMMAYRDFEYRLADLPEVDIDAGWISKILNFILKALLVLVYFILFFLHIVLLYAIGAIQLWFIIIIIFVIVNAFQHWLFGKKENTLSTIA